MILDYARETGCRTLAFTSRLYAPQEQRADVNLYVYRGEKEEFHTMSSAVAVIDALVLALSDSIQPKAAEELMRLQKLKEKNMAGSYTENKIEKKRRTGADPMSFS